MVRTFKLYRLEDVSGISGTGLVAEGVQLHDGQCALSWFSQFHSVEISPNIDTVMALHGHSGKTVLQWDEEENMSDTKQTKTADERIAILEEIVENQAETISNLVSRVIELEVTATGSGFSTEYESDEVF